MKTWCYQVRDQIEIDATIERVYSVASDPEIVPAYAEEVVRIELVKRLNEHSALVRSHLRVGGLTFAHLYRYHYRAPTNYSGTQEGGKLLRGYFSFTFQSRGARALVSHTEGITSPVPYLAWLVGFIYFRALSRGGVREELDKLKRLVEESHILTDRPENSPH
ncbi:MAG: Polyketide cyclase / dehydrase and lipid transport [Acidobacteriota bacterium]|nr:Polyketide cyclase / dehydrase and lipid transport [Acidobacteriota bacterium]